MIKSILGWIGLCLLFGLGMAADIPYVFDESPSGPLDYSSDQLEDISASSPELFGVPPVSQAADNETLVFPGNQDVPGGRIYKTVGEIKTAFDARAWQDTGIILYNQGNYGEALPAFDNAIKLDPFNADSLNCKGIVLYQLGRYREAIKYFDQAIDLNPCSAGVWCNKAEALYALGEYQEADDACEMAIAMTPRSAYAWYIKGQILKTEAEAAFARAGMLGLKAEFNRYMVL
ncbi:MAG: tetratricopeptide repeat protein [Methanotrichaceae archaeon]|nr:tetratricopeptide repeat protein [Methanotrichaceae archaeon]